MTKPPSPRKDRQVTLRLWGTLAHISRAAERRERERCARGFGVRPEQVTVIRMTPDNYREAPADKRAKRGGVDGGTGRDSGDE